MSKCTCGACAWYPQYGFWAFDMVTDAYPMGGAWTKWHEPRCPRCFDGLGEGGETTPAERVFERPECYCSDDVCYQPGAQKDCPSYYLLPAPEEVPE